MDRKSGYLKCSYVYVAVVFVVTIKGKKITKGFIRTFIHISRRASVTIFILLLDCWWALVKAILCLCLASLTNSFSSM